MASTLSVNVCTAPEKALVAGRARPFGPPSAWDLMTSTLVFGESDAVLVDALTTAAKAEALASLSACSAYVSRSSSSVTRSVQSSGL